MRTLTILTAAVLAVCAAGDAERLAAQQAGAADDRGDVIGSVHAHGDLAILELDEGVIAEANLFDLEGRTLRFTPVDGGYRVKNVPLLWSPAFGPEVEEEEVAIDGFAFPFSGRTWTSLNLGNGAITFTDAQAGQAGQAGQPGRRRRSFSVGRFDELREGVRDAVHTVPAISVFLKIRSNGPRYVMQMPDRVVVTWVLSEPTGGMRSLQDWQFEPTTNRFQAVLHEDGRVDMSYHELDAEDAIVGIFTVPAAGVPSNAPVPEPVDLSALSPEDAPAPILYEAFHHHGIPDTEDLACTVIEEFGDRFDFMVWYSDFRVDQQEGGTPSTGAIGDRVTGFGLSHPRGRQPADFCSDGRIQTTFILPVWIGANQSQERAPDGSWDNYDQAMSQIAHELAHRWSAFAHAIVDGDTINLGGTHWATGVHAEVPFSYSGGPEASLMGGGNWKDNGDGTFTQLADDFYSPASGPSYLDLYLMGLLAAEDVPDFFIIRDLQETGRTDADGNPIFTGDRLDITIEDIIAYNGPRLPAAADAQREFRTAMVGLVLPGETPSPELLERLEGMRRAWVDYWSRTTGGVSSMDTSLRD